ncbi:MAG: hypothetical protein HY075_09855 [Deltaproteobacteria bacterium]|nr:hypothetical protein [Deltaproteobacteria bacterium]
MNKFVFFTVALSVVGVQAQASPSLHQKVFDVQTGALGDIEAIDQMHPRTEVVFSKPDGTKILKWLPNSEVEAMRRAFTAPKPSLHEKIYDPRSGFLGQVEAIDLLRPQSEVVFTRPDGTKTVEWLPNITIQSMKNAFLTPAPALGEQVYDAARSLPGVVEAISDMKPETEVTFTHPDGTKTLEWVPNVQIQRSAISAR